MVTGKRSVLSIGVICFVFLMMGCNSGSSGGDGAVAEESVYLGLTSMTLIDEANARQIAEEAYLGGATGSTLVAPFSCAGAVPLGGTALPLPFHIVESAQGIVQWVIMQDPVSTPYAQSAIVQEQIYDEDGLGGSVSGTLQFDDVTGDFSGTITYSTYHYLGIEINGVVSVQGNYDLVTDDMAIDMNLSNYTAVYGGESLTMNGSASLVTSGDNISLTMNFVIQDGSTGKTYWMRDYHIEVVVIEDSDQVSISGSFYDADYGYVVLSTETPLQYNDDGDSIPSTGVLLVTGAEGTAGGSTRAWLVIQSSSVYIVYADTDGDDEVDWDSGVLYW